MLLKSTCCISTLYKFSTYDISTIGVKKIKLEYLSLGGCSERNGLNFGPSMRKLSKRRKKTDEGNYGGLIIIHLLRFANAFAYAQICTLMSCLARLKNMSSTADEKLFLQLSVSFHKKKGLWDQIKTWCLIFMKEVIIRIELLAGLKLRWILLPLHKQWWLWMKTLRLGTM